MNRLLLTAFLFLTTLCTYGQSNLVVFSTNPDNEYVDGTTLSFTIMITNNGPDPAANVNIIYAIPPDIPIPIGVTKFWWTGSNGSSGTNVPVNSTIPLLGVNQTVSFTINIMIPNNYTGVLGDPVITYDKTTD